jgi:hypothetical protein
MPLSGCRGGAATAMAAIAVAGAASTRAQGQDATRTASIACDDWVVNHAHAAINSTSAI